MGEPTEQRTQKPREKETQCYMQPGSEACLLLKDQSQSTEARERKTKTVQGGVPTYVHTTHTLQNHTPHPIYQAPHTYTIESTCNAYYIPQTPHVSIMQTPLEHIHNTHYTTCHRRYIYTHIHTAHITYHLHNTHRHTTES